jgi:hypothetical protein
LTKRNHTSRQHHKRINKIDLLTPKEKQAETRYILPGYRVFFSTRLARQYEPIIYSSECMSGDPRALYYRILQREEDEGREIELCIQYFYYWQYQRCMMSSHGHDYEPIFIYLKKKSEDSVPHLIVNGGLGGPNCYFHKNEVRPRYGRREGKTQRISSNLSPYPSYPFGHEGNIQFHACVSTYPLNTGEDLLFEKDGHRPLFGIRACSNVFSGAEGDLHGHRLNPPLKKLTDRVLNKWYFHHYNNSDDMPFGHDIADPFAPPYIKFHKPSKEEVERLEQEIG